MFAVKRQLPALERRKAPRRPAQISDRSGRAVWLSVLMTVAACAGEQRTQFVEPAEPGFGSQRLLILGDIEPDEPADRVRRFVPLARLLEERLPQVDRVQIRIARDIDEMARLVANGEVDLFFDSAHPTLAVRERAGTTVELSRKVLDSWSAWTVFVTALDSEIVDLAGIGSRTVAFLDTHSTTGYLLPATRLRELDYRLRLVSELSQAALGPGEVGLFFTGDEENVVEMVLSGRLPVGVISSQHFEELPAAIRRRLRVLDRTDSVPRELVSAAPGMAPELLRDLRDALLSIDDDDRRRLEEADPGRAWTWELAALQPETQTALEALRAKLLALELELGSS